MMKNIKNILFILIFMILASCSSSLDDNSDYYNPVEGEWNIYTDSGTILHKKIYTKGFDTYFLIIDGNLITNPEIQHYYVSIYNKLIFQRYEQSFSIDADTLWIKSSDNTQISKYIKQKSHILE